jgi:hypothetical protein
MSEDTPKGSEPIEGLVAGILTERELIINVGDDQGVQNGMKFQVLTDVPTEVTDPKTGEVLGMVAREKVRVMAVRVEPRYSVCRTYRVQTVPGGPLYFGHWSRPLDRLSAPPRELPETLKASDADYLPELPEEESFVKKGDPVVQIVSED